MSAGGLQYFSSSMKDDGSLFSHVEMYQTGPRDFPKMLAPNEGFLKYVNFKM